MIESMGTAENSILQFKVDILKQYKWMKDINAIISMVTYLLFQYNDVKCDISNRPNNLTSLVLHTVWLITIVYLFEM